MSEPKEPDEKLCIAVAKAAAKALEDWTFTGPIHSAFVEYLSELIAREKPENLFMFGSDEGGLKVSFYLSDPAMEPIINIEDCDLFEVLNATDPEHEGAQENWINGLERTAERLKVSFRERYGREPTSAPPD